MNRCPALVATSLALVTVLGGTASATTSSPTFLAVPPLAPLAQNAAVDINGTVGGSMTVGRFTVTVARGAFSGTSRVTIFVPDPSVLRCVVTMNPMPASFKTKPTIAANYSGATGTPKNFWMVNYVPATGLWAATSSQTLSTTVTRISEAGLPTQHGVVAAKTGW